VKSANHPDDNSARGLRLALMVGFGGMFLIFLIAAVDAVRLLGEMRAENKILRDASLDRSHRLSSIRSYILLSHTCLGDYLLDSDPQRSARHVAQLHDAWSRMLSDLALYPTSSPSDTALVKQLQGVLDQHWQDMNRVMTSSSLDWRRRGASFYGEEIMPIRTAVIEITTRLDDVDSRQLASTDGQIQGEF
jgi:hypothetical protein